MAQRIPLPDDDDEAVAEVARRMRAFAYIDINPHDDDGAYVELARVALGLAEVDGYRGLA